MLMFTIIQTDKDDVSLMEISRSNFLASVVSETDAEFETMHLVHLFND